MSFSEADQSANPASACCESADILAIQQLKYEYARYCDSGYDADALLPLFTEDATWESDLSGKHEGHQQIAALFAGASSRYPWAAHLMINPEIEIDANGVEARAHWVLFQLAVVPRVSAGFPDDLVSVVGVGRYDDVLQKSSEGWRFKSVLLSVERLAPIEDGWTKPVSKP